MQVVAICLDFQSDNEIVLEMVIEGHDILTLANGPMHEFIVGRLSGAV